LTVDCDDFRHIPKHQGHPTRSKKQIDSNQLSEQLAAGIVGFEKWFSSHKSPVTLFVIADSLQNEEFRHWLVRLISSYPKRITIGCHGLTHRSWSAWPEDLEGFQTAIIQACEQIKSVVGESFRPWFRAPAGYMAPWMASVLKQSGIILDSSINDTLLTKSKAGKGNSWANVRHAVAEASLVEREWATKWGLPINGPALSLFPLSWLAKQAWKKLPIVLQANELSSMVEDSRVSINTVYWHLLDHAKLSGEWQPPIPQSILNH
jgi:hypothetical protein